MESALRQLTGTIEQLQYRNQQLESQLKRMQDDTEYRFQQMGSRGGASPAPQMAPAGQGRAEWRHLRLVAPTCSIRRRTPNAPGAPRTLGKEAVIATPEPGGPPVGAPGGRSAGAPLDLSTLANTDSPPPQRAVPPSAIASAGSVPVPASQATPASPPPQVRNVLQATPNNQQLATAAAFGLAARRVRHGVWICPA
jgi:TolA-binding protein